MERRSSKRRKRVLLGNNPLEANFSAGVNFTEDPSGPAAEKQPTPSSSPPFPLLPSYSVNKGPASPKYSQRVLLGNNPLEANFSAGVNFTEDPSGPAAEKQPTPSSSQKRSKEGEMPGFIKMFLELSKLSFLDKQKLFEQSIKASEEETSKLARLLGIDEASLIEDDILSNTTSSGNRHVDHQKENTELPWRFSDLGESNLCKEGFRGFSPIEATYNCSQMFDCNEEFSGSKIIPENASIMADSSDSSDEEFLGFSSPVPDVTYTHLRMLEESSEEEFLGFPSPTSYLNDYYS